MNEQIDALNADESVDSELEELKRALKGDTMYRHCMMAGIPHALLEVRQDLIGDAAGQARWAALIALAMPGTPIALQWTRADEHGHHTDKRVKRRHQLGHIGHGNTAGYDPANAAMEAWRPASSTGSVSVQER